MWGWFLKEDPSQSRAVLGTGRGREATDVVYPGGKNMRMASPFGRGSLLQPMIVSYVTLPRADKTSYRKTELESI